MSENAALGDRDRATALAVYGSLRPGEANHWVLARIAGEWHRGVVRGWTFALTWGPAEGYDGFIPDHEGAEVEVDVLVSDVLPRSWRQVDDFEGPGYVRRPIEVRLEDGTALIAQIYVALTDS